jgi:Tetracyclin repressor-like, C-terminal domain
MAFPVMHGIGPTLIPRPQRMYLRFAAPIDTTKPARVSEGPEHLRMITWAQLEGFTLDEPQADGQPIPAQGLAAIEAAQASGHVDPAWQPVDLLVLLFAIGLAWAQLPHPDAVTNDPTLIAQRRAAAVEAATRIIATP